MMPLTDDGSHQSAQSCHTPPPAYACVRARTAMWHACTHVCVRHRSSTNRTITSTGSSAAISTHSSHEPILLNARMHAFVHACLELCVLLCVRAFRACVPCAVLCGLNTLRRSAPCSLRVYLNGHSCCHHPNIQPLLFRC